MGRVSKYKKIKACDVFSKESRRAGVRTDDSDTLWGTTGSGRRAKKRSQTATELQRRKLKRREGRSNVSGDNGGFDLAPPGKDDFEISDLLGSVKKEKKRKLDAGIEGSSQKAPSAAASSSVSRATIPQTDIEEKDMRRVVLGGATGSKSGLASKSLSRAEGESVKKFLKRADEDTLRIMKKQGTGNERANPEKAERKKQFLKQKKLKKRGGHAQQQSLVENDHKESDNEEHVDQLITGERAVAAALLDPAERPPEFQFVPKGAQRKKVVIPKALMQDINEINDGNKKKNGKRKMDETKIAAEQQEMEAMREKVKAQYRLMREKRRRDGDKFHL